TQAFSQSLHKKPPYDSVSDFAPVGLTVEQPRILVVRKDLPVSTLGEFIAYAKANPNKLKYGSAGAGSAAHVACMLLNSMIGVDITHVPYRATSLAMQDIAAGPGDCNLGGRPRAAPPGPRRGAQPRAHLCPQR